MGRRKLPVLSWRMDPNMDKQEDEHGNEEKDLHRYAKQKLQHAFASRNDTGEQDAHRPKSESPTTVMSEAKESKTLTLFASPPSCIKRKTPSSCPSITPSSCLKSVHFHEIAMVLWIEGIADMSAKELKDCFYTPQDYLNMREREKILLRQLSSFGTIRSTSDDVFGLESRVHRYHRKGRSRGSINAVVFEQEMSRNPTTGVCNDVYLSQVYRQYTMESIRLARERAQFNAAEVGIANSDNRVLPTRYSNFCGAPLGLSTPEEKMDETYQELKQAVESVERKFYRGVMKYAVACIPPSPATLRLGHDKYLDMAQPEDEKPWPVPKTWFSRTEFSRDEYDEEEKKMDLSDREETARQMVPSPMMPCGQISYYSKRMTPTIPSHGMAARPSAFRPPSAAQKKPLPPQWTWDSSASDFVPARPPPMITWGIY